MNEKPDKMIGIGKCCNCSRPVLVFESGFNGHHRWDCANCGTWFRE